MAQRRKRVVKCRKVIRRTSYTIDMKREVVKYAEQHGRSMAAKHFNINVSMVGRWVKASVNWITETNRKKKKIGSSRKALYPKAEEILYT